MFYKNIIIKYIVEIMKYNLIIFNLNLKLILYLVT